MKSDKTFRIIAIIALIFGVSGLTLAYAATLSSTLDVNGTVTATGTGGSWDVHFDSATATCAITDGTCAVGDELTVTPSLVTFTATLAEGQTFTANVPIKNAGTFTAQKANAAAEVDPCVAILAEEVETTDGQTLALSAIGFTCTSTLPANSIEANGSSNWGVSVQYPVANNKAPKEDVVIDYTYSVSYTGSNS